MKCKRCDEIVEEQSMIEDICLQCQCDVVFGDKQ